MVKEVAILEIDEKDQEEFERIYEEIAPIIRRQPGYHQDELLNVVENPAEYILIIKWTDVEAHQAFIDSADFPELVEKWGRLQKKATVRHGKMESPSSPDTT
jgi:heme-degrading monooxygenase HmoA